MSWKRCSNSDNVRPDEIDKTSSKVYVYVRKNFEEVPSYDMDGEQTGTHWEYDEAAVRKDDWDSFETAFNANELSKKNSADIEYIAMMADIEIE